MNNIDKKKSYIDIKEKIINEKLKLNLKSKAFIEE